MGRKFLSLMIDPKPLKKTYLTLEIENLMILIWLIPVWHYPNKTKPKRWSNCETRTTIGACWFRRLPRLTRRSYQNEPMTPWGPDYHFPLQATTSDQGRWQFGHDLEGITCLTNIIVIQKAISLSVPSKGRTVYLLVVMLYHYIYSMTCYSRNKRNVL